jgi:hypothetical protein
VTTSTLSVRHTVERAGVCADGDNCPRYHCRACGKYWLGDEAAAHACQSAAIDLEQTIYAWMAEELAFDRDLARCERNVLERLKAEGLGEALLDRYGPHVIDELGRDRDDDDDVHLEQRKTSNGHTAAPGVRRVDVAQLATNQALLECLFQVEGAWIRLGDLDKQQCTLLQRKHAAKAAAFGRLVEGLAEGQTVRPRWTAEKLEDLVGDTFGRAASVPPIQ